MNIKPPWITPNIHNKKESEWNVCSFTDIHFIMGKLFFGEFIFCGLSVLQTWIMPDEFYGAILYLVFCFWLCFHLFKTSSHLPKLFGKMLQHCFVVELQKCFVDMVVSSR